MPHGFTTNVRSVKRVIAGALVAALMLGCQRPAQDHGGDGGGAGHPLEMLVTNDPESLDPRYVTDTVGMRTTRLLHAGLTRTDPESLRPIPYLAASFRWVDPLTLDLTLREDVRFHSGAPFMAEDVVATLQAFASAAVASRHASTVEPIESVVAEGPHEVRIHLRRMHATLLSDLDLPILRHDQAAGPPDPMGEALDGLGPFEIEHTTRGEILLRPARLGAIGPAHESVAIRTVHDENARALRLYSGHADIAVNGISPTLLPALDGRAGLALATTAGANLTYLVVRVDRGALADVRLRQAISLGIDRQAIADSLFSHHATPASTVLPEGHWASVATPPPFAFDPEAARALVGTMTTAPKGLTLLTSTDRLRMTVARTMAQELGEVGIAVEVIPLELGTLIARLNTGDFDLASLQLPELTEPNILRVFLHSAFIPPAGANRGRVRDAKLDALLDLGDSTVDEMARAEVYGNVERRLREELFIIPLWHEDQVAVVSARAREFRPSRDGRWLSLATLAP
jgi:peptide/nickel transport system substrate-binding protein